MSRKIALGQVVVTPIEAPPERTIGLSRAALAEKYDMGAKTRAAIRKAVKSLRKDQILEDAEFRTTLCSGISTAAWQHVAEEEEFTPFRFHLRNRGRVWCVPADKAWCLTNIQGATE